MLEQRVREQESAGELGQEDVRAELLAVRHGRREREVADPHAGRQECLSIGVGDDRVRVDLRRAVERPPVEEDSLVGLVRDKEDLLPDARPRLAQRLGEGPEVTQRVDPAARVVGRVEKHRPRPGRDGG